MLGCIALVFRNEILKSFRLFKEISKKGTADGHCWQYTEICKQNNNNERMESTSSEHNYGQIIRPSFTTNIDVWSTTQILFWTITFPLDQEANQRCSILAEAPHHPTILFPSYFLATLMPTQSANIFLPNTRKICCNNCFYNFYNSII